MNKTLFRIILTILILIFAGLGNKVCKTLKLEYFSKKNKKQKCSLPRETNRLTQRDIHKIKDGKEHFSNMNVTDAVEENYQITQGAGPESLNLGPKISIYGTLEKSQTTPQPTSTLSDVHLYVSDHKEEEQEDAVTPTPLYNTLTPPPEIKIHEIDFPKSEEEIDFTTPSPIISNLNVPEPNIPDFQEIVTPTPSPLFPNEINITPSNTLPFTTPEPLPTPSVNMSTTLSPADLDIITSTTPSPVFINEVVTPTPEPAKKKTGSYLLGFDELMVKTRDIGKSLNTAFKFEEPLVGYSVENL